MNPIKSESGFVLAATLWILAAITLAAGFFAVWVQNVVELIQVDQDSLQGEIDMSGTRAALLYLLATQRMTIAGLTAPQATGGRDAPQTRSQSNVLSSNISVLPVGGEIPMDGRAFPGFGVARFSIQDEGGLLSLIDERPDQLDRLLGLMGVPASKRAPMLDKLVDYTDEDGLLQVNGAEAKEYMELGLPPPPNRPLLTSWEIRNVLGWGEYPEMWDRYMLPRLATIATAGTPNMNTAPPMVLKALTGIDDETARRIVAAREKKPFFNITDINLAAGKVIALDSFGLKTFPNARLRISLWYKGGRRMRDFHLQLTPNSTHTAPWLIDYELSLPTPPEQENRFVDKPFSIPALTSPLSAKQR
jgi:type II secretory pathway component PulK